MRPRKARHLTLSKSTDQLAVAIKPTLSYYTTLTLCKTYKYKHQLDRIEEWWYSARTLGSWSNWPTRYPGTANPSCTSSSLASSASSAPHFCQDGNCRYFGTCFTYLRATHPWTAHEEEEEEEEEEEKADLYDDDKAAVVQKVLTMTWLRSWPDREYTLHPPPSRVVQIFCKICTVVQTVLRLCKHPAGCTRLCKYSAEVAVAVQTLFRVCRLFKVLQIFCRICSCCTNPLQVVQTFCSNDTSATHTHGPPTTPDTFSIYNLFKDNSLNDSDWDQIVVLASLFVSTPGE